MLYIVISILTLILGFFGVLSPVRDGVHIVSAPMQVGLEDAAVEIKNAVSFFFTLSNIRNENLELLEEMAKLNSEIVELKDAQRENLILREQLGLSQSGVFDKNLILADVLGNPQDQTGATIILNKGAKHGVREGASVIIGRYLVGIVRKTTTGRSAVALITSPDVFATVVDIDSPGRTEGLSVGLYGTSVQMTRILPREEVDLGDTIATSGVDGVFEPGLIVGKVLSVTKDADQPLKNAFLDTIIDLSRLEKVFVVAGE